MGMFKNIANQLFKAAGTGVLDVFKSAGRLWKGVAGVKKLLKKKNRTNKGKPTGGKGKKVIRDAQGRFVQVK
jgi:hypothetical protein